MIRQSAQKLKESEKQAYLKECREQISKSMTSALIDLRSEQARMRKDNLAFKEALQKTVKRLNSHQDSVLEECVKRNNEIPHLINECYRKSFASKIRPTTGAIGNLKQKLNHLNEEVGEIQKTIHHDTVRICADFALFRHRIKVNYFLTTILTVVTLINIVLLLVR